MSALTVSKEEEKRLKGQGFLNNRGTDEFSARVITVNGKVTAAQHRCMAEAAEKFGNGNLTYTTRLSVEIQGIPYEKIEEFQEFIAKEGLETGGTGAKVRPVVSCKGTTCQYGLLDSYAISEEIYKRFYEGYSDVALPHKFKIAVGGCPNNCVKPNLNDVGIIGQRIPEVNTDVCKGCKKCAIEAACPNKVAKVIDGKIQIDKEACRHCGRCVGKCPFTRSRTALMDTRSTSADAGVKRYQREEHLAGFLRPKKRHLTLSRKQSFSSEITESKENVLQKQLSGLVSKMWRKSCLPDQYLLG